MGRINSCQSILKLKKHEDIILLSELGAIIHDLGKLNTYFLEEKSSEKEERYKIDGKEKSNKYFHGEILKYDTGRNNNFPPNNEVIERKAKSLLNLLKILPEKIFINDFMLNQFNYDFNFCSFLESHHDETSNNFFVFLLRASDKLDSFEDRANAHDSQSIEHISYSNAFGYEKKIDLNLINEREKVYDLLIDIFNSNSFKELIKKIKKKRFSYFNQLELIFNQGLGMTARGANDVSLWEHSYMTATIMKTLFSECILSNTLFIGKDDLKKSIIDYNPFKILSIGWDSFQFLSQIEKVSDINGRMEAIQQIKKEIEKSLELNYLVGNCIYKDDNSLHFLIPKSFGNSDIEFIKSKIYYIFNRNTDGILVPYVSLSDEGSKLQLLLPKAIYELENAIKKKIIKNKNVLIQPRWKQSWESKLNANKTICKLCGKAPISDKNTKLCKKCHSYREAEISEAEFQTKFLDEISWNNKDYENLSVFVLNFNLINWLNGKYIFSLFMNKILKDEIKFFNHFQENREILNLFTDRGALSACLNAWSQEKENIQAKNVEIKKIQDIIDIYSNLDEDNRDFLKELHFHLNKIRELIDTKNINTIKYHLEELSKEKEILQGKAEDISNKIKNKKTPSPSRLMRIWNNTKNFFKVLERKICDSAYTIERYLLRINGQIRISGTKEIELIVNTQSKIGEAIINENEIITITPHLNVFIKQNAENIFRVRIIGTNQTYNATISGKQFIRGYRIISESSPINSIFIIPASKSLEILNLIMDNYHLEFGKAFGKLPLNIGVVYFKKKTPLSYVFDSARRFLENFGNEHIRINDSSEFPNLTIKRTLENRIVAERNKWEYQIEILNTLEDGETDYYHPYIMVNNLDAYTIEVGEKIKEKHILNLKEGDKVLFHPSFFDFQYLDSNVRRFDIFYDDNGIKGHTDWNKRKSDLFGEFKSRPYILEDIQRFNKLKDIFKTLGSWSLIKDIEELLIAKKKEWSHNDNHSIEIERDNTFEIFIKTVLENKIRLKTKAQFKSWDKTKNFLKNSILEGIFFDAIELFHTIMSIKLEE